MDGPELLPYRRAARHRRDRTEYGPRLRLRGEGGRFAALYVAGDTIFCPEVEEALDAHRPDVVVVNAGAARLLEGDPITMTAEDVARVCRALPDAHVISVHMEAINHCLLTRSELEEQLQRQGLEERVKIPADGETLEVP
jgi:L-ascorbate metabolism protein UlaG (beta-lactamase superfamily)